MGIYLYWGEDDFAMARAIGALREQVLDPAWAAFNFEKISPEDPDAIMRGLNQAMTPPFGAGGRLVWLINTTICQHCSAEVLAELERTSKALPETTTLLLTTSKKPDSRLKSTKLLKKAAEVKEFSPIPPWRHEELVSRVREAADEVRVSLAPAAAELLATSVGNDTRSLFGELEKLRLYAAGTGNKPLSDRQVRALVTSSAANSLELASAILQGNTALALGLLADLTDRNEPGLKIVATLIGQFRTWLWVKLMVESGERDIKAIALAADVGNPKRIYFLRKDVEHLSLEQLMQTLPILLDLEVSLKRGAQELSTLQTKIIELCYLLGSRRRSSSR